VVKIKLFLHFAAENYQSGTITELFSDSFGGFSATINFIKHSKEKLIFFKNNKLFFNI